MAEEFSDDYEFETGSESGASNRPFLIAVGALVIIMILAIAGTGAYLLSNRDDDGQQTEIAARVATNEAIATQNSFVTQTLEARETEAAQPTSTPEPTNTAAPTETPLPPPTELPAPTDTPVVGGLDEGAQGETGLETPTPDFSGAINAGGGSFTGGGGAGTLATPTPISGVAQGSGTLPTTGIEVWSALGLAAVALALVVAARRLRTQL
jgi:hypothetical protein